MFIQMLIQDDQCKLIVHPILYKESLLLDTFLDQQLQLKKFLSLTTTLMSIAPLLFLFESQGRFFLFIFTPWRKNFLIDPMSSCLMTPN